MSEQNLINSTNEIGEMRETGSLITDVYIAKDKFKKKEKPDYGVTTTVRFSSEANTLLDLIAFKFDKKKGFVIKTLLEAAIFQMAGENGLLEGKNREFFESIMREEKARKQKNS